MSQLGTPDHSSQTKADRDYDTNGNNSCTIQRTIKLPIKPETRLATNTANNSLPQLIVLRTTNLISKNSMMMTTTSIMIKFQLNRMVVRCNRVTEMRLAKPAA